MYNAACGGDIGGGPFPQSHHHSVNNWMNFTIISKKHPSSSLGPTLFNDTTLNTATITNKVDDPLDLFNEHDLDLICLTERGYYTPILLLYTNSKLKY